MPTFLKKIVFLFLPLFVLLVFTPIRAHAEDTKDYFDVNANLTYAVQADTLTRVTQKIAIINKKEFVYSPSYSITLHLKNISNISVRNADGNIPYTLVDGSQDAKTIDINFPDKVVGIGKSNNFTFSFTSSDFTDKIGSVVSVRIPSLSSAQNFNEYVVAIQVPSTYPEPSIVKPAVNYQKSGNTYTFTDNAQLKNGVELIFGDSQVYQFRLDYHLENSNVFPVKTELALPPNTSYQEVLLQSLSPKPDSTYVDADGNTLATYTLKPKTTINATADVLIKVNKEPLSQELSDSQKALYTKSQKYWEVSDPEIQKLARELKTPQAIYNYVVKTLSYDTKKTAEENTRLGAKQVLTKPYFAVCLEFTDLFVAIARAAGIPARAVEGYAYTDDSFDKPVSLFQDVLHAWPEYYDTQRKAWIMVDPTWENTTGGNDYFNSLDFNHVAFAVNGAQSTYPVPAGGYKTKEETKDINVSFPNSITFVKEKKLTASGSFSSFVHSGKIDGKITLTNLGNYEVNSYDVNIYLDGKKSLSITFPQTPPLGQSTVSVALPLENRNFITSLTNLTHTITIADTNGNRMATISVRTFPFSEYLVIGGAITLGIIFVLIIAFKTRSVPVQRQ